MQTIEINNRSYEVEEVMDWADAKYAAMLKGERGARVHYEIRHDGSWFALGGIGSRSPRIIAEG